MERGKITEPISEAEPSPVDISGQVADIFNSDSKYASIKVNEFLHSKEISKLPAITLTLDYKTLGHAKWVKAFLEYPYPRTQKRSAAIRATESQRDEAANIFASNVTWIPVEE